MDMSYLECRPVHNETQGHQVENVCTELGKTGWIFKLAWLKNMTLPFCSHCLHQKGSVNLLQYSLKHPQQHNKK